MVDKMIKYTQGLQKYAEKHYPDISFNVEFANSNIINILSNSLNRNIRLVYDNQKKILFISDDKIREIEMDFNKNQSF